jgi:Spy/CpxP family protein refolding chaperone
MRHINRKPVVLTAPFAVIAMLVLPVSGCDQEIVESAADDIEGSALTAGEATPNGVALDADRSHRRHDGRRDGPNGKGRDHGERGMLVRLALDELDLTADQRDAVEAIRGKGPEGKRAGATGDRRGFHEALVSALRTGTLDRAALEAFADQRGGAGKRAGEGPGANLVALHGILTPEQRATLVDLARARSGGLDARVAKGERGHGPRDGSFVSEITRGIDLTDAQRARVAALVEDAAKNRPAAADLEAKRLERRERHEAMLRAFASDSFDAATLEPPKPLKGDGERGECKADQIEGLLGILTEAQRLELADRLERHAGRGFGRHGDGRGFGRHGDGRGFGPPPGEDLEDEEL